MTKDNLTDRIAELLEKFDYTRHYSVIMAGTDYPCKRLGDMIIETLRTGNTDELEKGQK